MGFGMVLGTSCFFGRTRGLDALVSSMFLLGTSWMRLSVHVADRLRTATTSDSRCIEPGYSTLGNYHWKWLLLGWRYMILWLEMIWSAICYSSHPLIVKKSGSGEHIG